MDTTSETEQFGEAPSKRWLLRVEEAAELLGVSRSLLYALIANGELPSLRISGCRRIPVGELREWLKNQNQ